MLSSKHARQRHSYSHCPAGHSGTARSSGGLCYTARRGRVCMHLGAVGIFSLGVAVFVRHARWVMRHQEEPCAPYSRIAARTAPAAMLLSTGAATTAVAAEVTFATAPGMAVVFTRSALIV